MKKILLLLVVILNTLFVLGQRRLSIELSAQTNCSFSNDVSKTRIVGNNSTQLSYNKRERYQRPYYYLFCNAYFHVSKKIAIGLASGVQAHFYPKHYNGLERTFVAVPIIITGDYNFSFFKKDVLGVFFAAGGQFYNVSYFGEQLHNSLIFTNAVFYKINKKGRIKLGIEKQIDFASVNYKNSSNTIEVFHYPLNRLSIFLGVGWKIR